MKQSAILLHPDDDVATALTALHQGDRVEVSLGDQSYTIIVNENIAFGHKFALRAITQEEQVLKYGLPIGKALSQIQPGDWVHVHNCRSDRFGFRHEQYGIIA